MNQMLITKLDELFDINLEDYPIIYCDDFKRKLLSVLITTNEHEHKVNLKFNTELVENENTKNIQAD